jgi:hypothetical protein
MTVKHPHELWADLKSKVGHMYVAIIAAIEALLV